MAGSSLEVCPAHFQLAAFSGTYRGTENWHWRTACIPEQL